MSQALHIFKKDLGHLRLEISLFIALTVVYAWAEFRQVNQLATWALLAIAAVYLIARVIHAEAIPGDSQFWISRPYRWENLLGAKLLFILVVVNLPVLIARLAILVMGGFPVGDILPGLLWSHFLIFSVFSLTVAAIAALTAGLVSFIFSVLLLLAAAVGIQALMDPLSLFNLGTLVNPMQWVWDAMVAIVLAAGAALIVWIQYKNRSTRFSRKFAVLVAVAVTVAYLYLPWPVAFAVQKQLFNQKLDSSQMRVAIGQSSKRLIVAQSTLLDVRVGISIPVTGIPDGVTAEANSFGVALRDGKGHTWKSELYHPMGTMKAGEGPGHADFNGYLLVPRAFFEDVRGQSASLSGSIYLTLFGNAKTKTVALPKDRLVDVMDGLQCGTNIGLAPRYPQLYCRSPFRWPAKRMDVTFDASDTRSVFARSMSYSPFPAELSLENVVFGGIVRMRPTPEVTFTVREPLKSVRLDFEVPDIQFVEFPDEAR